MLVARGAFTSPFGNILGNVCAIDALVPIANLAGLQLPNLAVTRGLTGKRMSNLMKQDLMHQIKISMRNQVLGDGDSAIFVVA